MEKIKMQNMEAVKKKQLKAEETLAERYENQRYRVKKGVDTLLEIGIRKKILNKNLKKN